MRILRRWRTQGGDWCGTVCKTMTFLIKVGRQVCEVSAGAWQGGGPGHPQQLDDLAMASRITSCASSAPTLSLSPYLSYTQDAPGAEAMWSQLEDVTKACYSASDVRSVNGLLRFLQTPERTAAVQPDGLTVQMRSYQLQSLQFMLDAEARDGGYRSVFWVRKVNTQGRTFWYSPVMSRASLSVPEQPAGGFLAEEMVRLHAKGVACRGGWLQRGVCAMGAACKGAVAGTCGGREEVVNWVGAGAGTVVIVTVVPALHLAGRPELRLAP